MTRPVPSALTLPAGTTAAPSGSVDGTWNVARGSQAGIRVAETVLGMSKDVVWATGDVTGAVLLLRQPHFGL